MGFAIHLRRTGYGGIENGLRCESLRNLNNLLTTISATVTPCRPRTEMHRPWGFRKTGLCTLQSYYVTEEHEVRPFLNKSHPFPVDFPLLLRDCLNELCR